MNYHLRVPVPAGSEACTTAVHVTPNGFISINVDGTTHVAHPKDWINAMERRGERSAAEFLAANAGCRQELLDLCRYITALVPADIPQLANAGPGLKAAGLAELLGKARERAAGALERING